MIIFLREKFIAQIFMWVIAVVFVIATFLLYSGSSGPQQSGAEGEVVIKIGAFEITRGTFENLISRQMDAQRQNQRFNQNQDPKVIQKNIIDFYIKQVIEGSAKITNAEIEHHIRSNESLVNYYNQSDPEEAQGIKNQVRSYLSATSLRDSIQELELVTDTEVEQDLRLDGEKGEKAKIKFIEFPHSDYKVDDDDDIDTKEAELYYQKNKDQYKTEEQVNVKFIQVKPENFVTQDDIVKYFTDNPNEFLNPELPIVKARHILKEFPDGTRNPTDEQREETKKEAEELLKTVKEGLAAGTTFADLAKEHSEGPSGVNGGALRGRNPKLPPGDYFARGDMVKPFEEACFDTLNPGDVSDLIETSFGYHIIKLEERNEPTPQTFPEVENEIRDKLIQINGVDNAERTAEDLVIEIELADYDTATSKEMYKELKLKVGETDFFSKGQVSIPEVGPSFNFRGLADELFDTAVGVTKTVETKNFSGDVSAYFVITVLGKKPPTIPDFESVKDKVIDHLKKEKSKELAFTAAQELINLHTANEVLDDLVKKYKAPDDTNIQEKTVQESNQFSLSSNSYNVSGMGVSKGVMFAAFDMSVGDIQGPYQGNSAAYIIELTEREEPELDETDRLEQHQTILNDKRTKAYDNWLAARENGIEIWIHEDYR